MKSSYKGEDLLEESKQAESHFNRLATERSFSKKNLDTTYLRTTK